MLSEKAKGKQRADPILEDVPEHGGLTQRELMVRFTEGVQDLVLRLAEHDSVHDVKVKVRPPRPSHPVTYTPFQLPGTSDPRRTSPAAAPPLAPHTRGAPAHGQHEVGVVAQHARGAPAACRRKGQRWRRLVDSTDCARSKLGALAATLFRRPAALRGRGGRRCPGPGTPTRRHFLFLC